MGRELRGRLWRKRKKRGRKTQTDEETVEEL
jgi:hypothetical protein